MHHCMEITNTYLYAEHSEHHCMDRTNTYLYEEHSEHHASLHGENKHIPLRRAFWASLHGENKHIPLRRAFWASLHGENKHIPLRRAFWASRVIAWREQTHTSTKSILSIIAWREQTHTSTKSILSIIAGREQTHTSTQSILSITRHCMERTNTYLYEEHSEHHASLHGENKHIPLRRAFWASCIIAWREQTHTSTQSILSITHHCMERTNTYLYAEHSEHHCMERTNTYLYAEHSEYHVIAWREQTHTSTQSILSIIAWREQTHTSTQSILSITRHYMERTNTYLYAEHSEYHASLHGENKHIPLRRAFWASRVTAWREQTHTSTQSILSITRHCMERTHTYLYAEHSEHHCMERTNTYLYAEHSEHHASLHGENKHIPLRRAFWASRVIAWREQTHTSTKSILSITRHCMERTNTYLYAEHSEHHASLHGENTHIPLRRAFWASLHGENKHIPLRRAFWASRVITWREQTHTSTKSILSITRHCMERTNTYLYAEHSEHHASLHGENTHIPLRRAFWASLQGENKHIPLRRAFWASRVIAWREQTHTSMKSILSITCHCMERTNTYLYAEHSEHHYMERTHTYLYAEHSEHHTSLHGENKHIPLRRAFWASRVIAWREQTHTSTQSILSIIAWREQTHTSTQSILSITHHCMERTNTYLYAEHSEHHCMERTNTYLYAEHSEYHVIAWREQTHTSTQSILSIIAWREQTHTSTQSILSITRHYMERTNTYLYAEHSEYHASLHGENKHIPLRRAFWASLHGENKHIPLRRAFWVSRHCLERTNTYLYAEHSEHHCMERTNTYLYAEHSEHHASLHGENKHIPLRRAFWVSRVIAWREQTHTSTKSILSITRHCMERTNTYLYAEHSEHHASLHGENTHIPLRRAFWASLHGENKHIPLRRAFWASRVITWREQTHTSTQSILSITRHCMERTNTYLYEEHSEHHASLHGENKHIPLRRAFWASRVIAWREHTHTSTQSILSIIAWREQTHTSTQSILSITRHYMERTNTYLYEEHSEHHASLHGENKHIPLRRAFWASRIIAWREHTHTSTQSILSIIAGREQTHTSTKSILSITCHCMERTNTYLYEEHSEYHVSLHGENKHIPLRRAFWASLHGENTHIPLRRAFWASHIIAWREQTHTSTQSILSITRHCMERTHTYLYAEHSEHHCRERTNTYLYEEHSEHHCMERTNTYLYAEHSEHHVSLHGENKHIPLSRAFWASLHGENKHIPLRRAFWASCIIAWREQTHTSTKSILSITRHCMERTNTYLYAEHSEHHASLHGENKHIPLRRAFWASLHGENKHIPLRRAFWASRIIAWREHTHTSTKSILSITCHCISFIQYYNLEARPEIHQSIYLHI